MCAAFELNSRVYRPGKAVSAWRKGKAEVFTWAGFARHERLAWWIRQGGELVDVPAQRFAERSDLTRALIWGDVPDGCVVRGLVLAEGDADLLLKVVTRASDSRELTLYQHDRMPLLEAPLFRADAPPRPPGDEPEADLFGRPPGVV